MFKNGMMLRRPKYLVPLVPIKGLIFFYFEFFLSNIKEISKN